jgi:hypothetical protein
MLAAAKLAIALESLGKTGQEADSLILSKLKYGYLPCVSARTLQSGRCLVASAHPALITAIEHGRISIRSAKRAIEHLAIEQQGLLCIKFPDRAISSSRLKEMIDRTTQKPITASTHQIRRVHRSNN